MHNVPLANGNPAIISEEVIPLRVDLSLEASLHKQPRQSVPSHPL